jgi:hypothetical protein
MSLLTVKSRTLSTTKMKNVTMITVTITTIVDSFNSDREGQETRFISWDVSLRYCDSLFKILNGLVAPFTIARPGRGGRARTRDPRFWRPMLYQLSYTPAVPTTICPAFRPVPAARGTGQPVFASPSARLPMQSMLIAPRAELLVLHSVRMESLVLLVCVVPLLALFAGKDNDLSRHV